MTLNKNDADLQRALGVLRTQAENMARSRQTVQGLLDEEISSSFKCAASTVYQSKLVDWLARYDRVKQKFDAIHENLTGAGGDIDTAHDDAAGVSQMSFSGAGDSVYQGLSG